MDIDNSVVLAGGKGGGWVAGGKDKGDMRTSVIM